MPIPQNFQLKTQTSHDVEGGFRIKSGGFQMQSSIYNMDLENEIHFNPGAVLQRQSRSDPPLRLRDQRLAARQRQPCSLRGGAAYTRAVFREGPFAGNDVPLVSRYTASGGVTWNIWQNYLVVDATVRDWSERFMDNDQANTQRLIPANATVDFKLSGEYEHFFWSVSVNNLFNALYYDYAIASSFTDGRFSAYPLPGRAFLVRRPARPILASSRSRTACPGQTSPDDILPAQNARENTLLPMPMHRTCAGATATICCSREIANPDTQWSLGTFDAIAEILARAR